MKRVRLPLWYWATFGIAIAANLVGGGATYRGCASEVASNRVEFGNIVNGMTPVDFESDREILDAALPLIGLTAPQDARLLWIRNTLDIAELACSRAYLQQARSRQERLGQDESLAHAE